MGMREGSAPWLLPKRKIALCTIPPRGRPAHPWTRTPIGESGRLPARRSWPTSPDAGRDRRYMGARPFARSEISRRDRRRQLRLPFRLLEPRLFAHGNDGARGPGFRTRRRRSLSRDSAAQPRSRTRFRRFDSCCRHRFSQACFSCSIHRPRGPEMRSAGYHMSNSHH